MNNTDVILSLYNSSFPLAQCMGLEAGEPFGFDVFDACFKSEDILDEVYYLDKTLLEGSHDVFVHKDLPSRGCNNALPNPLIIPMFHVFVHYPLNPSSIILIRPLIIF